MTKSKPIFEKFLDNQDSWREKWQHFEDTPINFSDTHFKEELTPFYGLPEFNSFTLEEKKRLFYAYIKLVAEAQIFLEQTLMYGFYYFRNRRHRHEENVQSSIEKLSCEELYHSQAFRTFLSGVPQLDWPNHKIFPMPRWVRTTLAFVIKRAPLGMTLPGAKIEAFSMSYYRLLRNVYGKDESNSWYLLNYYHHVDESFHVPLEFDLYNSSIYKSGPIKTLFSTLFFIVFLQYALLLGSWNLIRMAFPQKSITTRLRLVFRFTKWAIRHMPAFEETRLHTKKLFKQKRPLFGQILSFMHW
jgi:hypothetical protein